MPSNARNQFDENVGAVRNLLLIHGVINNNLDGKAGRPFDATAVLHQSAILVLTACWEAYVEDVMTEAFDYLVKSASTPSDLPKALQKQIAKRLRSDLNELKVLKLVERRLARAPEGVSAVRLG